MYKLQNPQHEVKSIETGMAGAVLDSIDRGQNIQKIHQIHKRYEKIFNRSKIKDFGLYNMIKNRIENL